jgi:hypothetical protein
VGTRRGRCDNGDSLGDYVGKANEWRQKMLDVKARVVVGMAWEGRAAVCEVVLRQEACKRRARRGRKHARVGLSAVNTLRSHAHGPRQTAQVRATRNRHSKNQQT